MKTISIGRLPSALTDFLYTLPGLEARAPLIAFCHDGFALEGALVLPRGKTYRVAAVARSQAASYTAAVLDILQQVAPRAAGRPRRALLVTACATPALLELPLDGAPPRSDSDMLGLVRWELEPLLAEQLALWSLGTVLEGRGHLDRDGRVAIAAAQTARQQQPGRATPFGEIAQELGLATREQVDEALAVQTQLQSLDGQSLCAWAPRGRALDSGPSLWLAAGIGLSVQARWVAACEGAGLHLGGIYALAGSSLGRSGEDGLRLELHGYLALAARCRGGFVERLLTRAYGEHDAAEVATELVRALHPAAGERIVWCAIGEAGHAVAERLRRAGGPLEPLPPVKELPLAGAAALAGVLEQNRAQAAPRLPRLLASQPPPPLFKRSQTWVAAAVAALILLVAGYEITANLRFAGLQAQVTELSERKRQIEEAKSKVAQHEARIKEAQDQTRVLREVERRAQAELAFFREELIGRWNFLAAALSGLADTVGLDLVVEELAEDAWFALTLRAWSASQAGGYRFAKDYVQALKPWRFEVRDLQVQGQTGRNGQPGYAVQFSLIRPPPAGAAAPAAAPVITPPQNNE